MGRAGEAFYSYDGLVIRRIDVATGANFADRPRGAGT